MVSSMRIWTCLRWRSDNRERPAQWLLTDDARGPMALGFLPGWERLLAF